MRTFLGCIALYLSLSAGTAFAAESFGNKVLGWFGISGQAKKCESPLASRAEPIPALSPYDQVVSFNGTRRMSVLMSIDLQEPNPNTRDEKFLEFQKALESAGLNVRQPDWEYAIETTLKNFVVVLKTLEDRDAILALVEANKPRLRISMIEP